MDVGETTDSTGMPGDSITSKTSQNISGSGRKRGHQHHIRHSGTRSSSVRADEVIAALRRGDHLPVTPTNSDNERQMMNNSAIDISLTNDEIAERIICDSSDADQGDTMTDQNGNQNTEMESNSRLMPIDISNKNHRLEGSRETSKLSDPQGEQLIKMNVISRDSQDLSVLNSDIDMESGLNDELNDSISSGSSSGSKLKSKRSKKNQDIAADTESRAKREKRTKKSKNLPPAEERPPLEGADSDQWIENDSTIDTENDPEAAEWAKLRCTSERTEVVAEREYRRQNRRCADYPGLAFGRSIFSSDTMMKLNIIRNELHNIMKTQLKRVCVLVEVTST